MEYKYDVFISYSSIDQKIAEGVCGYLESYGIRCFVAYRDIPRGVVWASAIVDALEASRMMVVLFSEHFNTSKQVDREIELASEDNKPILTFRLTDHDFSGAKKYYLKNLNWIDAFPEPDKCFNKLAQNIGALLNIKISFRTKTSEKQVILSKQKYSIDEPHSKDGKYGYPQHGIPYKYDDAKPFEEGFGAVCLNGKWGFVDLNGTELIPLKYNDVHKFYEGLAAVKIDEKWGFIDRNDNTVIPFKFDDTNNFEDGLTAVQANKKWGVIDKRGNKVVPFKYDFIADFCEDMAYVVQNHKYGFINKQGVEVIPVQYDYAGYFYEGLVYVDNGEGMGFINKQGDVVIPFIYDGAMEFQEGLAAVAKGEKWGFVDKQGNEVIPFNYDNGTWFSDGMARVYIGDRSLCIDKLGNTVYEDFIKTTGEIVYDNGTYNGEYSYLSGIKALEGHGTFIWKDGSRYEGEWNNNKRHGKGTCIFPDGSKYIGEWINNKKHGKGTMFKPNGSKIEGEWKDDRFTGSKLRWFLWDKFGI